jgi:benzoylformate decarboxylase
VPRRGRDILVEVLLDEGVTDVFGDELAAVPDLHHVRTLDDATAVAMADGFAQATGRPAYLNLRTGAGLGQAVGNLTNALANGTALVVTAANADRGDLVGLAAGATKAGEQAERVGDLGFMLRRAFTNAALPAGRTGAARAADRRTR